MPKATDEKAFDLSNIYHLKGQITGQGNINPNDVAKIKVLLGQAGVFGLSETQGLTGFYGLRLEQGLKKFQKQRELKVDAEIDPNGEALQALKLALGDQDTIQNATQKLQKMGRKRDKVLAHLNPEEAEHLPRITDDGSINRKTRLLEFYVDDFSTGDLQEDDNRGTSFSGLDVSDSNEAPQKPGISQQAQERAVRAQANPVPKGSLFDGDGGESAAKERAHKKPLEGQRKNKHGKTKAENIPLVRIIIP